MPTWAYNQLRLILVQGIVVLVAVMMIAEEVVDVLKVHLMQVEIAINQVLALQIAVVEESAKIYLI
jgi:hypothetical protein